MYYHNIQFVAEPVQNPPSARYTMRRQSTTEEILIARGFRRESRTEDMMRCRNFRRQSTTAESIARSRPRRDSCCQITDGQLEAVTFDSERDSGSQNAGESFRRRRCRTLLLYIHYIHTYCTYLLNGVSCLKSCTRK